MKTEEDEAFDELAKRQGSWGGGFKAKQAMVADKFIAAEERKVGERYGYVPKLHPSEWMGEPAQEPEREALKLAELIEHFDSNDESLPLELLKEIAATLRALAQPVQEPPSEWAGIKAILDEYGLQAIDFVADFKAFLAQPAQEQDWKTLPPKDAPLVQWVKEQTAPPQREWVGLTAEEIASIPLNEYTLQTAERLLKEKNG